MHLRRWWFVPVVIAMLLGLSPAQAASDPVVKDTGRNIYEVDGRLGAIPHILAGDEVERIQQLRRANRPPSIISTVSPDDQLVAAIQGNSFGVLNIQDGSFQSLPVEEAFFAFSPLALLGFGDGFGWRGDRTLVTMGVGADPDTGGPLFVMMFIDADSGAVDIQPLPNFPPNALPGSISPDGSQVILVASQENPEEEPDILTLPAVREDIYAAAEESLPDTFQAIADRALSIAPKLAAFSKHSRYGATYQAQEVAEESLRLLIYNTVSGESRDLKTYDKGLIIPTVAWSRDGSRVALSTLGGFDLKDEPDPRERRLPYDGALLSEQIYRDATGNLPPDENPLLQNNAIDSFDLTTGETKTIRGVDHGNVLYFANSWSTDNQTLLVQVLHPAKIAGRRYPIYNPQFVEQSSWRFLDTNLDEVGRFAATEVAGPLVVEAQFVSPDEVLFTSISGTNFEPFYYNRVSGEFRRIASQPGSYFNLIPTRLSRQFVYVFSSFTEPPDLYRLNWDGKALFRLSWANEELRQLNQTRQYPVSFRLANRQTRTGTLILPADVSFPPKNIPIVVWQEGGPGGAMNNQWLTYVEAPYGLLPNFGFGLLVVPLAGREGNGPKVYNALADNQNFGQIDVDEQAEISRQMISRGWTSSSKLGITGCSYGGYFTWQSIIRYPSLYAAANPQCSLVDNITEWNRGYPSLMPFLEGLPPYVTLDEYRYDSPAYNAASVKAAVLSFHGSSDFLPITQNQNLHLQLVNADKTAKMLIFVGSGHGLVSPGTPAAGERSITTAIARSYEVYATEEQIQWFRTYLK